MDYLVLFKSFIFIDNIIILDYIYYNSKRL